MKRDERRLGNGTTSGEDLGMLKWDAHSVQGRRKSNL